MRKIRISFLKMAFKALLVVLLFHDFIEGIIDENICLNINSCKENIFFRKCYCDSLCPYYEDCCWDAPRNTSIKPNEIPQMSCVRFMGKDYFWIVNDCPDDYDNINVRAKCTKDPSTDAFDPDIAVPVWSSSTAMAYQNRHCAECYGVTDAVPYNMSVRGFKKGCKRPATASPMDVLKHYLQPNSSCIVEFMDNSKQRKCYAGLVSTCLSNDSQTQNKCESGLLNPVYVLEKYEGGPSIGFRNYDCYACSSFYPSQRPSCTDGAHFDALPMRVLIDTTGLTAAPKTSHNAVCGKEQVYDHIYVRFILLFYCFVQPRQLGGFRYSN